MKVDEHSQPSSIDLEEVRAALSPEKQKALASLEKAVAILEEMSSHERDQNRETFLDQMTLAKCYYQLGSLLIKASEQGEEPEIKLYQESIEAINQVIKAFEESLVLKESGDPEASKDQVQLTYYHYRLADMLYTRTLQGDFSEYHGEHYQADILKQRQALANFQNSLVLKAAGQQEEAQAAAREAKALDGYEQFAHDTAWLDYWEEEFRLYK